MPVRHRKSKARAGEIPAWAGYLEMGSDYFDELERVGLTEATARPLAEETWHRIGTQVIQYLEDFYRGFTPPERPYWAEREFGPPGGRRRRSCH